MYIITGQTATGKTAYALNLAQKINGELINCDSRQVYKYLNIITGKDIPANDGVRFEPSSGGFKTLPYSNSSYTIGHYDIPTPLWLYDVVDPKQYFSFFDYKHCALFVIEDILKRGKVPIIVGGTYLYIKQLFSNVTTEHVPPNLELRSELETYTVLELQKKLQSASQKLFDELNESDRQNPRRLMRKIEIALFNQKPITTSHKPSTTSYELTFIGFRFAQKKKLIETVRSRVEKRLKQGAIEEVQSLLKRGYTKDDPGMKTIGYQEVIEYLEKKISFEKMIESWTTHEVQYAKRQLTFMKSNTDILWTDI